MARLPRLLSAAGFETAVTAQLRLLAKGLALALALALPACAGNDDETARFFVAPGKFVLFNCKQLAVRATEVVKRLQELEGLIAKAGTGTGGEMVSAAVYRPEVLTLRGDMIEIRKVAVDKKCEGTPSEAAGGATLSSGAIR
jgi:hypothetical protein